MPFRIARLPLTFLVLAFVLALGSGCTKRTPALASAHPGEGGAGAEGDGAARGRTQQLQEGPDVRAVGNEGASGSDIAGGAAFTGEGGPLADIHFELDSAALSDEARSTLEKHALWLQGQRGARVTIEGHCDERGTVEYNLALGEQRARATRDYLVSLGVGQDRLRVVSFGKERPLATGGDESSFAQNRRAHFAVGR
ncbi:MAG TPA: peptidoglycan-associated lipoprotein Pal [Vicinamibacteria bacterium]